MEVTFSCIDRTISGLSLSAFIQTETSISASNMHDNVQYYL